VTFLPHSTFLAKIQFSIGIYEMVRATRKLEGYRPMPILFNEDDHFDFDQPVNNMLAAVGEYASWGLLDIGEGNYRDGYQSVPVNWGASRERKRQWPQLEWAPKKIADPARCSGVS
jgi:hypothetical protein